MERVKNKFYYEQLLKGEIHGDGSEKDVIIINKLKNSNKDLLNKYNSKDFASSVYFSIKEKRKKVITSVTSMCSVFIITIVIGLNINTNQIRLKGAMPVISLYKNENGVNKIVNETDVFRIGDILQITYFAKDWSYGTIISVDGNGVTTLHYPSTFNEEGFLINSTEAILPYSYELDDAKEFERFYFIVSKVKFNVKEAFDLINKGSVKDLEKLNLSIADTVEIKKE